MSASNDWGRLAPLLGALSLALVVAACGTSEPNRRTSPRTSAPIERAPIIPRNETPEQESARIRSQRDLSANTGVIVYSAGSFDNRGMLRLLVEPLDADGRARWLRVSTTCEANCVKRAVPTADQSVDSALVVENIEAGRWRLSAVGFDRRERQLKAPLIFAVRNGFATYLGAFAIQAKPTLRIFRYSAMQNDLSRALSQYPQTRGRRMINTAKKLRNPILMR